MGSFHRHLQLRTEGRRSRVRELGLATSQLPINFLMWLLQLWFGYCYIVYTHSYKYVEQRSRIW